MFKNPNYKQYDGFILPYNEQFICGFVAYLYWIFLYVKLFWLGTEEDRVELSKCYDEAVKNEVTIDDSFYEHNFSHYYRTACDKFLTKIKREAYEDDEKRRRMVELARIDKERDELNARLGNITKKETKELRAISEKLDDENEGNDIRNKYCRVTINGVPNQHRVPQIKELMTMNIPVIKEEEIRNTNGDSIHIRIYDKIWNFYTAVIWSDIEPLNEDGSVNYKYVYAETLEPNAKVKGFGRGRGVVALAREKARMENLRLSLAALKK